MLARFAAGVYAARANGSTTGMPVPGLPALPAVPAYGLRRSGRRSSEVQCVYPKEC